jgi:gliding motility-associated-like protein
VVRAPELQPISPLNLQSGSVTVAPCGVSYQVLDITNVLCNGDASGSVSVAVTGASDDCGCVWTDAQNNTVSTGTIGGNNCSLLGQRAGTYRITISCSGQEVFTTTEVISQPAAIALNPTAMNVACGTNGSVALNVSGGTSPYAYNWSNAAGNVSKIENLAAGTYNVTVTDANNCTATNAFTITENTPDLTISNASIMDASCNGEMDGAITIEISGGCPDSNGNYTIAWQDAAGNSIAGGTAITGLSAGNYMVNITDTSNPALSVSMTYSVGEPGAISVAVGSVIPSDLGNNGSIQINVTGGATPYSYVWNPVLSNTANPTGLAPGTYAVTVTDDNGCTGTLDNIVVAAGGPVVMNVTATSGACSDACEGIISGTLSAGVTPVTAAISGTSSESITLNALGEFSFDELCPGTYTLTVTDANSEVVTIENLTIVEIQPLMIVREVECSESTMLTGSIDITVTGGTAPYSYQWSTGASSEDLNGVGIGNYSLLVTDANGCEAILNSVRINDCGGGECDDAISVITPNGDGFNDFFVINCIESFNARLAVYDRSGIKVFDAMNYQNDWGGTDNSGDLLPEGSYMWVAEKDLGNGTVDLITGTVTVLIEY